MTMVSDENRPDAQQWHNEQQSYSKTRKRRWMNLVEHWRKEETRRRVTRVLPAKESGRRLLSVSCCEARDGRKKVSKSQQTVGGLSRTGDASMSLQEIFPASERPDVARRRYIASKRD